MSTVVPSMDMKKFNVSFVAYVNPFSVNSGPWRSNMKARVAAMEQLIVRLTNEMNVLRKENKTLDGNNQDSVHDRDPSANEHKESR